jgi:hypothetical protein
MMMCKNLYCLSIPSHLENDKSVNPTIIMAKVQQLSWRVSYSAQLVHQDNCCKSGQFNVGIYTLDDFSIRCFPVPRMNIICYTSSSEEERRS